MVRLTGALPKKSDTDLISLFFSFSFSLGGVVFVPTALFLEGVVLLEGMDLFCSFDVLTSSSESLRNKKLPN